ncbi:hypothetical protein G9A89_006772 [Geosiphon pyriformis]|nr:hypothetical protein G9A89_006772 [Geosiphon pyriformis]
MLDKAWRVTYGDDWMPNFPFEGYNREIKMPTGSRTRYLKIVYRHLRKEFWIEPACDCLKPKIYLCYHTATLHEHEECNGRNHFHKAIYPGITWEELITNYRQSHPDEPHFGPYFRHTMLQRCPLIKKA